MLSLLVFVLLILIIYKSSNKEHLLPDESLTVSWTPPSVDNNNVAIGDRKLYYTVSLYSRKKDRRIFSDDNDWIEIAPMNGTAKHTFQNVRQRLGIGESETDEISAHVQVSFSQDGNNPSNVRSNSNDTFNVPNIVGDTPGDVSEVTVSSSPYYIQYNNKRPSEIRYFGKPPKQFSSLSAAKVNCNERGRCNGILQEQNKYYPIRMTDIAVLKDSNKNNTYLDKNAPDKMSP